MVAAAALLPMGAEIAGINDSKLLHAGQPDELAFEIPGGRPRHRGGEANQLEMDSLNIAVAGRRALQRAVEALGVQPDYVLVDGFVVPELSIPHEALIKGDRRSASIMAGAIIAKTSARRHHAGGSRGLPRVRPSIPTSATPRPRMPRLFHAWAPVPHPPSLPSIPWRSLWRSWPN